MHFDFPFPPSLSPFVFFHFIFFEYTNLLCARTGMEYERKLNTFVVAFSFAHWITLNLALPLLPPPCMHLPTNIRQASTQAPKCYGLCTELNTEAVLCSRDLFTRFCCSWCFGKAPVSHWKCLEKKRKKCLTLWQCCFDCDWAGH